MFGDHMGDRASTLFCLQTFQRFAGKERGLPRSCRGDNIAAEILQAEVWTFLYCYGENYCFLFIYLWLYIYILRLWNFCSFSRYINFQKMFTLSGVMTQYRDCCRMCGCPVSPHMYARMHPCMHPPTHPHTHTHPPPPHTHTHTHTQLQERAEER